MIIDDFAFILSEFIPVKGAATFLKKRAPMEIIVHAPFRS